VAGVVSHGTARHAGGAGGARGARGAIGSLAQQASAQTRQHRRPLRVSVGKCGVHGAARRMQGARPQEAVEEVEGIVRHKVLIFLLDERRPGLL